MRLLRPVTLAMMLLSLPKSAEAGVPSAEPPSEAQSGGAQPAAAQSPGAAPSERGRLRVTSSPAGAQVFLDGEYLLGLTPLREIEVDVGPHVLTLQLPGHAACQARVQVQAGHEATGSCTLTSLALQAPPSFGRTTQSAFTLGQKQLALDLGGGYPTYLAPRLTVGVAKASAAVGSDLALELRSVFLFSELLVRNRLLFLDKGFFGLGIWNALGAGGGPRWRMSFVYEHGVAATLRKAPLLALSLATYFQVYVDQLCPPAQSLQGAAAAKDQDALSALVRPEHAGDACTGRGPSDNGIPPRNAIADAAGYDVGTASYFPEAQAPVSYPNAAHRYRGRGLLEPSALVRWNVRLTAEITLSRHINLFAFVEGDVLSGTGAAYTGPRLAHTHPFNAFMPMAESSTHGGLGLTWIR